MSFELDVFPESRSVPPMPLRPLSEIKWTKTPSKLYTVQTTSYFYSYHSCYRLRQPKIPQDRLVGQPRNA